MTIRDRINQLRQLCGEDPAAALAAKIDALPLHRNEAGWIVVRDDGSFVFVDNDTGRIVGDVPDEWVREAVERVRDKYPEVAASSTRRPVDGSTR